MNQITKGLLKKFALFDSKLEFSNEDMVKILSD